MWFSADRATWAAGLMLAVAYVLTLCELAPLPLQDFPAHLENAVALSDLIFHGGQHFGEMFRYQFLFMPYVLGDLGFAASVEILGMRAGSAFWLSFVFLSLPLALLCFMRVAGVARESRSLVFILSLYLASDWFFVMGFLSFRLGIALTVVGLALVIRLRNAWSNRVYVGYGVLVAVGYLVHLTTIAFLTPAVILSSAFRLWKRTSTLRKEVWLCAPLIALWAWHFLIVPRFSHPDDPIENPYVWGTPYGKLIGLNYEFARYNLRWDLRMIAVFVACLLVSALGMRARDLKSLAVREMLLLVAAFVAIYVVLPRGYSEAWYVDVRALALASVCAVLAFACLPRANTLVQARASRMAAVLALALITANLIYLHFNLARSEMRLAQYRAVVASIPTGARVLPVMTRVREGNVSPCRHMDAFITIDRAAFMPYAFNADTANPEKYLRYVRKPYAPAESWYLQQQWDAVDWRRVAANYDYLLVEKPFDAQRIRAPRRLIVENDSAALFVLESQADLLTSARADTRAE